MLKKYGKDASVTNMVDRLDWVIMPVFNVDGYEFTHTGVSATKLQRNVLREVQAMRHLNYLELSGLFSLL